MDNYLYYRFINAKQIIKKCKHNFINEFCNPPLSVAISTNSYFLTQARVLIRSLINSKRYIRLYLLNVSLNESELEFLKCSCPINVSMIIKQIDDECFKNLKVSDKWPKEAWARIFIPEIVPEEIVLYLDVDCIVVNGLDVLFALGQTAIISGVKSPYYLKNFVNSKKLTKAINSGVMLLNTKKLVEFEFREKIINFANKNSHLLVMPDQDSINYVCNEIMDNLKPEFNSMNFFYATSYKNLVKKYGFELFDEKEYWDARFLPKIIHFNGGPFKRPWGVGCLKHPYTQLYHYYDNFDNSSEMNN